MATTYYATTTANYPIGTSTATWQTWLDYGQTTTAASTQIQYIWTTWNTTGTGTGLYTVPAQQHGLSPATPEEIEEHRRRTVAQAEVFARQAAERTALQEATAARASGLLLEVLDDEQAAAWKRHEHFDVRVRDGKRGFRTFRLHHRLAGGVVELDDKGKPRVRYCIHLTRGEPTIDTLIAQKLMLETDLPGFERVANRSIA